MKRAHIIAVVVTMVLCAALAVTLWAGFVRAPDATARGYYASQSATPSLSQGTPVPRTAVAPTILNPPYVPSGKHRSLAKVVSAAGLQQYLECGGPYDRKKKAKAALEPPLVVIPGLKSGINYLSGLTDGLRQDHYVCVYDRPGIEMSPPRTGKTDLTSQDHARELEATLTAAGITGKLILLPHSYPGLVGEAFWQSFPQRVAALALLDTPPPGMGVGGSWSEAGASIDITKSQALIAAGPKMGTVPLMLVSSDDGSVDTPDHPARGLNTFSSNRLHVTAVGSVHEMWHAHMPLMLKTTQLLVDAAVTGKPLPKCSSLNSTWARMDAACH